MHQNNNDHFLIIKASAGSGKTFRLVVEYICMAIRQQSFRNILAVTFTKAATREMKERILQALAEMAEGKNSAIGEIVKERVGLSQTELQQQAAQLLKNMLFKYGHFNVSTIDSFFQKIIRSFARELDLPFNAGIELNQQKVIDEVISMVFDQYGKDKSLTAWFQRFVEESISDGKNWNIKASLASLAAESLKETTASEIAGKEVLSDSLSQMQKTVKSFKSDMAALGKKATDHIASHQLQLSDFSGGSRSFAFIWERIQDEKSDYLIANGLTKTFLQLPESQSWYAKKSTKINQIEECVHSGLNDILQETIDHYLSNIEVVKAIYLVQKNIYAYGIISNFHKQLSHFRDENDLVLISDINRLLNQLITGTDAPFVYEKTGNHIQHYLIDEFQDTSTMQWNNFKPLVENALAQGNNIRLVGDVKQSIYRWRGGDSSLLIEGVEQSLPHFGIKKESLDENYRSLPAIIHFNNYLFDVLPVLVGEEIGNERLMRKAYDSVHQNVVHEKESTGYVEMKFHPHTANNADEDENNHSLESYTLETVLNLQSEGVPLKDICILVRTNNIGKKIANKLKTNQLNVISPESLLLEENSSVRLIIYLLKFLSDSRDIESLYLSVSMLMEKMDENPDYHAVLQSEADAVNFLMNALGCKINSLQHLDLNKLVNELILKTGLHKQHDIYLQRLLDFVQDYITENGSNLRGLLEEWENTKDRLTVIVPQSADAVKVMTIHKSKGLAFPIVIVPGINEKLAPNHKSYLWPHDDHPLFKPLNKIPVKAVKDMEQSIFKDFYLKETEDVALDVMNLLYVAFTRTRSRLYCQTLINFKKNDRQNVAQLIYHIVNKLKLGLQEGIDPAHPAKPAIDRLIADGIEFQETDERITQCTIGKKTPATAAESKADSSQVYYLDEIIINQAKPVVRTELSAGESGESKSAGIAHLLRGNFMHQVLAKLKTAEDLQAVLKHVEYDSGLSKEEAQYVSRMVSEVLAMPEVKKWYEPGWKVWNERDILLPGGEFLRPDRVIEKDGKAIVIDYKTGKAYPSHEQQLEKYCTTLLEMGYTHTKAYVLYVDERNVVEVV